MSSGASRVIARMVVPLVILGILGGLGVWLASTHGFYRAPREGMYPTYDPNERLVGRKHPYAIVNEVKRGDVVVYKTDEGTRVGRVVGLPREKVAMVDDVFVVNDERFKRTRLRAEKERAIYSEQVGGESWSVALLEPQMNPRRANMQPIELGADELFILGDERHAGQDSRDFGPVKLKAIEARVVYP